MKAKEIAKAIKVSETTFSRWKHSRPELYERIIKSYEYEELLNKLELKVDELKDEIRAYKEKK